MPSGDFGSLRRPVSGAHKMRRRPRSALAREADADNITIVSSKDGYLIGPGGKRFIDFTSGWCVGNFGWNDRSVHAALKNFKGPTYVYPSYRYEAWDELAALFTS